MECAIYRTTKERLEKFAGGRDLRTLLTEGLLADDASRKRDSVDRNVRNWLNGNKDLDIPRETAMEIAFVLELSIQDTNALLASLTEEGLRWRDPDEIIMAFARMKQMSYPQALALKARLGRFPAQADLLPVSKENLTQFFRGNVMGLRTEEELKELLISSEKKMGTMHNTAYTLFTRYMNVLEAPDAPAGEKEDFERVMSVREVLQKYLYRDLVPVSSRKKKEDAAPVMTPQRKAVFTKIRAGWPDESTLSKMKSREIDVDRKVLILLFLATDGDGMQFSKSRPAVGSQITQANLFKENRTRLNRMLGGCGYELLDPRSPFDWIVIYCLCVDSVEETDKKMADLLTELFLGSQKQDDPRT